MLIYGYENGAHFHISKPLPYFLYSILKGLLKYWFPEKEKKSKKWTLWAHASLGRRVCVCVYVWGFPPHTWMETRSGRFRWRVRACACVHFRTQTQSHQCLRHTLASDLESRGGKRVEKIHVDCIHGWRAFFVDRLNWEQTFHPKMSLHSSSWLYGLFQWHVRLAIPSLSFFPTLTRQLVPTCSLSYEGMRNREREER